jgi:hypothetical protein
MGRYSNDGGYGKIIVSVLAIAMILVSCFAYTGCYRATAEHVVFTVNDKDRVSYGSGDSLEHKYLIYTDVETFECTDSWSFGKFNSSDIYGRMKRGSTYKAKVAGWRHSWTSSYRNIITLTKMADPEPPPQPEEEDEGIDNDRSRRRTARD